MTLPAMGFSRGWFFVFEAIMNKQTQWQRLIDEDWDAPTFEKLNRSPASKGSHNHKHTLTVHDPREPEFRCVHCNRFIPTSRAASGVNNRNHCPWCLFSRHVDLHTPGDRLATCHSKMAPIGLTLKQTPKKYGRSNQGELMLIHQCLGCGKISINRIARDDDAHALYQVFKSSPSLSEDIMKVLMEQGIAPLTEGKQTVVFSQLFGWQAIVEGLTEPTKMSIPVCVDGKC